MEQELFEGLKKGRNGAWEVLCRENLRRCWFLCCQMAGDPPGGASLLLASLKGAAEEWKCRKELPGESLQELLSQEILSQYRKGVEAREKFQNLPMPHVAGEFQPLVREVEQLPGEVRPYYWMYAYGDLNPRQIAQAAGLEEEQLERRLKEWEEKLAQRRAQWEKSQRAAYIRLTTQFRDGAGNGFAQVQLPAALLTALGNEAGLPIKPPKVRKEKPWTKKRLAVLGITVGGTAVLLALVVLALILSL